MTSSKANKTTGQKKSRLGLITETRNITAADNAIPQGIISTLRSTGLMTPKALKKTKPSTEKKIIEIAAVNGR
jgi:hypothetical protein